MPNRIAASSMATQENWGCGSVQPSVKLHKNPHVMDVATLSHVISALIRGAGWGTVQRRYDMGKGRDVHHVGILSHVISALIRGASWWPVSQRPASQPARSALAVPYSRKKR